MEHLVLGKYRADCVSRFQSCVAAHVQGGRVLNTGAAFFFLPTWNQLALVPLLAKGLEKQDRPDPESAQRGF